MQKYFYKKYEINFYRLSIYLSKLYVQCSGGYHLERGGMLLHDAAGINCEKGATTEYQGAYVKYMG